MDARTINVCRLSASLVVAAIFSLPTSTVAALDVAQTRTANFIIEAPTQQLAVSVGQAAEKYRHDLAVYWLGKPLPPWNGPCPIRVVAGNYPAQGVTTYNQMPVRDFQMEVIGTPTRILDSVLPHEITHTVLATHFGRPLPRWADEGICTTVEHPEEKDKHEVKLREFLQSRRGIAMNRLFLLTEYPSDILPMYAQGYSVCRFLIEQKDARSFIGFLEDFMDMPQPSWTSQVRLHYGYESLAELQQHWLAWVADGGQSTDKFVKNPPAASGGVGLPGDVALAGANNGSLAMIQPVSSGIAASGSGQGWYQRNRDSADPLPRSPAALAVAPAARRSSPQSPSVKLTSPPPANAEDFARPLRAATPLRVQSDSAARGTGSPSPASLVPPSVKQGGYYSVAHPRPEQGIRRTGIGIAQLPTAGPAGAIHVRKHTTIHNAAAATGPDYHFDSAAVRNRH